MIGTFFVFGMLAAILLTVLIYRKTELGKVLTVGMEMYFCFYVIASGVLAWMELFSIKKATFLVLVLEGILIAAVILFGKKGSVKLRVNLKKDLVLAIILVAFAFVSKDKAELFPSGQDQGLYQARAMLYMGGFYDTEVTFPEFYNIENAWEMQFYLENLKDMEGYYMPEDSGVYGEATKGVLHGVVTFPALLALWGKFFGLHNMTGILTVFYLLTIASAYYLCNNLKVRSYIAYAVAVFTGICPIILWCSKNILTEMFLTLAICMFFQLLTENAKKRVVGWSVLPLIALCFYHVSVTILIPLFLLLYLFSYLLWKNRQHVLAVVLLLISYPLGFSMMLDTAEYYTLKNYAVIFGKTGQLLNEGNVEGFVWGMSAVLLVCSLVAQYFGLFSRLRRNIKSIQKSKKAAQICKIVFSVLTLFVVGYLLYKGVKAYGMDMWIMKLSTVGLLIMSGYVMLPCAIMSIMIHSDGFLQNRNRLLLSVSLLYVLLIYCTVVMVLIYYYYYYARYLAPFMIIIFALAGTFLDRIKPYIVVPVCVAMAILVINQSQLLYREKDLTYGDFEVVESMASCIGERDAVLILEEGYHVQRLFMIPIKGLTGADIYFVNKDAFQSQIALLRPLYEDLFMLGYDTGYLAQSEGDWKYVYQGKIMTSVYNSYVDTGLPYATAVDSFESPVGLMIYMQ